MDGIELQVSGAAVEQMVAKDWRLTQMSETGLWVGKTTATNGDINKGGKTPASDTVCDAAWIICAVSLRGQQRFKFAGNINGYCWDGTSTTPITNTPFRRLTYFGCKIDFVGAVFSNKKKRVEPIGYFYDEPVYDVERVQDAEPIVINVPATDVPLQDSKTSFKLA